MSGLRVDVLIDNHNYARYLPAAIDSALAQRDADVRVVVVDDGSTDASRAVLAGYGDRVTAVLKENGGQASAVNAGFPHCRGDVVIVLDADDVLLPGTAAMVAAAFAARPGTAKVQYRMEVIDDAGAPTGALMPPATVRLPSGDLRREQLTFPFDLTWMAMSGNAFCARVLERILPMPEPEYRINADWYLQHVTPLHGTVTSLDTVGARYRVHGANGYARAGARLDLGHVRKSVVAAAATRRALRAQADALGLPMAPGPILSVADQANRLVSLKLAPAEHPPAVAGDTTARLAVGGMLAALRRSDVRRPMQLMFVAWFAAMALLPRHAAHAAAEAFLVPERRRALEPLLRALRTAGGSR